MYKKVLSSVLLISVILSGSACLFAQEAPTKASRPPMGLKVQPGGLLVQYVPLGVAYDFQESVGIPLIVYNRDVSPHTYVLSTDKPSTVAARKWLKGYLEIPNSSWFWFEKDEVTVGANSKQEVNMYLKIPDEEKYYNQHWTVALGVKAKPEPGHMLALAVYPRIQIETLSRDDVKEAPDGIMGFAPSVASLEDVVPGEKRELKIRIYNNDTKRHRYKIRSKVFQNDSTREVITISQTYSWVPNPKWIKPKRRSLVIDSRESRELTLSIKVPEGKENYGRKWEGILFIEPKKGLSGFVRIQITTVKE